MFGPHPLATSIAAASIALCLTTSCQQQSTTPPAPASHSGPGALMSYRPQIAFIGGSESFSARAEPTELGVIFQVDRGFIDRVDIEIDGKFYSREYIIDRTSKGKFVLPVDFTHLAAGDHSLRVTAYQGTSLPRPVSGRTDKLPFVIIR